MAKPRSQIGTQFRLLGNLVSEWNDLESHIRLLLMYSAPDLVTAGMLAADMQIGQLISTTKMVAKEQEDSHKRMKAQLVQRIGRNVRRYEPSLSYIEHLLACADILREHRNYYVHGAHHSPRSIRLSVARITSRGRVSFSADFIDSDDLRRLIREIELFNRYAARLTVAVRKNKSRNRAERPTWPKKPPTPDRIAKRHSVLLSDLLQHQSFSE